MPFNSSSKNATIAANELIHALQHPAPAAPFSKIGDKQMKALQQLATIFQQATTNAPTKTIAHTPIAMRPTAMPRWIPSVSPRVMTTTPPTIHAKSYLIPPPVPLPPQANEPTPWNLQGWLLHHPHHHRCAAACNKWHPMDRCRNRTATRSATCSTTNTTYNQRCNEHDMPMPPRSWPNTKPMP